jgi:hypothetical protein
MSRAGFQAINKSLQPISKRPLLAGVFCCNRKCGRLQLIHEHCKLLCATRLLTASLQALRTSLRMTIIRQDCRTIQSTCQFAWTHHFDRHKAMHFIHDRHHHSTVLLPPSQCVFSETPWLSQSLRHVLLRERSPGATPPGQVYATEASRSSCWISLAPLRMTCSSRWATLRKPCQKHQACFKSQSTSSPGTSWHHLCAGPARNIEYRLNIYKSCHNSPTGSRINQYNQGRK